MQIPYSNCPENHGALSTSCKSAFEAISEYYISVTTLISHGFLSVGDENILYETDLNGNSRKIRSE
jgi:hypothetical protein